MEQYNGIKETNDLTDAAWLAEMQRLGIFPSCYIYPKEVRSTRDLLRRRQLIVRQRTQSILSLKSLIMRYGLEQPKADDIKRWTQKDIQATGLEDLVQLQLEMLLASVKQSDGLAGKIDAVVLDKVKPTRSFTIIQVVPGIGKILALVILLESGEFDRFITAGDFASYCRTFKSVRTSNDKKKGCNNSKNGNKYLAWAFIEAATYAQRFYPEINAWYERKG